MKRKAYCCDASRHMYENYYSRQVGGEIPVFAGSRHQRGHGIGSVLGGLFRRFVIPLFTTHGRTLALDALRTCMNVAEDVLGGGRGLKESVKKRVPEGIKRTAQNLNSQSGSGNRRRRIVDNNNNSKKKKTKKTKKKKCNRYLNDAHINDIFA